MVISSLRKGPEMLSRHFEMARLHVKDLMASVQKLLTGMPSILCTRCEIYPIYVNYVRKSKFDWLRTGKKTADINNNHFSTNLLL